MPGPYCDVRTVIASSSASAVPRAVASRAACFSTNCLSRSGRSSTMQPRVVWRARSRKSCRNADFRNLSFNERESSSDEWIDSFVNCTIGHGSMSPHGLMWCEMPVAAGHNAWPSPS